MRTLLCYSMVASVVFGLITSCTPCKQAIAIQPYDTSPPDIAWIVTYRGEAKKITGDSFYMELYDSITVAAMATDLESGIAEVALSGSATTVCTSTVTPTGQNRTADFATKKASGLCQTNKARQTLSVSYDYVEFTSCTAGYTPVSGRMTLRAVASNGAGKANETRLLILTR